MMRIMSLSIVIAIPLLAMGLGVRAQELVPVSDTYTPQSTPELLRPWTCDSFAQRQAQGEPAGSGPFDVPLAEDPIPLEGEPDVQFVPFFSAIPPILGFNFPGAQIQDSGVHPPDTMGAVGPNHFMEVINGNVSIFLKNTGERIASESLLSFFRDSGLDTCQKIDPRVLFDQHSERWIVITACGDSVGLAVSQTDYPMGVFCRSSFVAAAGLDASAGPDYPTLGVDANGIYIGAKMSGVGTGTIWAIEKPPLLAVLPSPPIWGTITAWRGQNSNTNQPAHTYGTPNSQYIISASSTNRLRIRRIDPPLSAPTMYMWIISVPAWGPPLNPPALDSSFDITMTGSRLMMSVFRDGSLWTTHTIDVNGKAGIRWYEIDPTYPVPSNLGVRDLGNVTHASLHFYMPSLMVNSAGHVAMAFSGSDESSYVGAYYTGRRAGDPSGEMGVPQLMKAGEGPYNGVKWGDYSNTTLDPVDQSTFWTIQEYASPGGYDWGTWIAALGPFPICNDNAGNSPLVCVGWANADPPDAQTDFVLDFGSDPNSPGVVFRTGNDGWKVWSQESWTDYSPANLGHIKIDPDLTMANFSLEIAHGLSPGAANVASMILVDPDPLFRTGKVRPMDR